MSITIADYINNCKFVLANILDEQERIILANENEIISLNVDAMQKGDGSDGNILKNRNDHYSGRYTLATQLIAEEKKPIFPKTAGELYNFGWFGDFLPNLQIEMHPDLTKFDIFSTGTGSGDKSIFFAGYTNLFGLDKTNTDIVNNEIIYSELMKYIKKYL
jgi:hypothetical protein